MVLICDKCIWGDHQECKDKVDSLGIIANEISIKIHTKVGILENSIEKYMNLHSYEEKMRDVRIAINETYEKIKNELEVSKKNILGELKHLIVDGNQESETDKKISSQRKAEYNEVKTQISKMNTEMNSMIENEQYARVYNERIALKKFLDSVEVVNSDLQNHISENRPPIEEVSLNLSRLACDIEALTQEQKVKFSLYHKLGIPNLHIYKPFQLYFKKYKKKLIENDPDLSLLDAGIY